jgi:hypothetical protein
MDASSGKKLSIPENFFNMIKLKEWEKTISGLYS